MCLDVLQIDIAAEFQPDHSLNHIVVGLLQVCVCLGLNASILKLFTAFSSPLTHLY